MPSIVGRSCCRRFTGAARSRAHGSVPTPSPPAGAGAWSGPRASDDAALDLDAGVLSGTKALTGGQLGAGVEGRTHRAPRDLVAVSGGSCVHAAQVAALATQGAPRQVRHDHRGLARDVCAAMRGRMPLHATTENEMRCRADLRGGPAVRFRHYSRSGGTRNGEQSQPDLDGRFGGGPGHPPAAGYPTRPWDGWSPSPGSLPRLTAAEPWSRASGLWPIWG